MSHQSPRASKGQTAAASDDPITRARTPCAGQPFTSARSPPSIIAAGCQGSTRGIASGRQGRHEAVVDRTGCSDLLSTRVWGFPHFVRVLAPPPPPMIVYNLTWKVKWMDWKRDKLLLNPGRTSSAWEILRPVRNPGKRTCIQFSCLGSPFVNTVPYVPMPLIIITPFDYISYHMRTVPTIDLGHGHMDPTSIPFPRSSYS
jgi:hypothetical protein